MSVKISRREEKRNTSLRDFLLASLLPLIIFGLLGFLLGRAGTLDAATTQNDVETIRAAQLAAETNRDHLNWLIGRADTLHDDLTESIATLTDELNAAIAATQAAGPDAFNDPLADWTRHYNREKESFLDTYQSIKGTSESTRTSLSNGTINAVLDPVEELARKQYRNLLLTKNRSRESGLTQQNLSEEITAAEEDASERVEIVQKEKLALEVDLQLANSKLNACQESLAQAAAGEAPEIPSHAREMQLVLGAADRIEAATTEISKGMLGKNEAEKAVILGALERIRTVASGIE